MNRDIKKIIDYIKESYEFSSDIVQNVIADFKEIRSYNMEQLFQVGDIVEFYSRTSKRYCRGIVTSTSTTGVLYTKELLYSMIVFKEGYAVEKAIDYLVSSYGTNSDDIIKYYCSKIDEGGTLYSRAELEGRQAVKINTLLSVYNSEIGKVKIHD